MSALEYWLNETTRGLSKDSAAQVRNEIRAHYESAREAAITNGAASEEADRIAYRALGDSDDANDQYRRVLLTSAEARILGEGNWEARVACSRGWIRWILAAIPLAAVLTAAVLFFTGSVSTARVLVVGGMGMGLVFLAPLLPIYTRSRSRIFRPVKWIMLSATLVLAFGPNALKWSWLIVSSLWPLIWIEWTRMSIRRKLPVAKWPKQLYF
jgi:hypothetical protein